MTRKELKQRALDQLKTRWLDLIIACFVYNFILGLASAAPIVELLICGPLAIGFTLYMSRFVRTSERNIETLFEGLSDLADNLILGVLRTIYVLLWGLLFIVPGIIMSYAYAPVYWIKAADPSLSATECLAKSKEIMRGHKGELFLLDLSFIGWWILCMFTFGIGAIWLVPYQETTKANYFLRLMRDNGLMKKPEQKQEDSIIVEEKEEPVDSSEPSSDEII